MITTRHRHQGARPYRSAIEPTIWAWAWAIARAVKIGLPTPIGTLVWVPQVAQTILPHKDVVCAEFLNESRC